MPPDRTPRIGVVIPLALRNRVLSPPDQRRLEALGDVRWHACDDRLPTADAARLLAGCEIGLGSWGTPWPDEELLNACPDLRLWVHVAGTVKHMFGPHLAGRDIVIVTCAPGNAENVAEMTVGELIVGLRGILPNAAANRANATFDRIRDVRTLGRCVVGVIGASQVGRRVIQWLRPYGPKVLLYDPFVEDREAQEMGATLRRDLIGLCAESDAVTLHTPALPSTRRLLGAREFQAMPDHAVFINTARGMCIDEGALIAELEKGRLFAFLDVTDPEPPAEDSPLRTLPNVVCTSHIAGPQDFKLGRNAIEDVEAYLRGDTPRMAVTSDMLDRIA